MDPLFSGCNDEILKITIDHTICIKIFFDGTVPYLTVSNDDFIKSTNNETEFTELRRFFEEDFEIKVQEGSVIMYLNVHIFQSYLGFSIDQTNHTMELVNSYTKYMDINPHKIIFYTSNSYDG